MHFFQVLDAWRVSRTRMFVMSHMMSRKGSCEAAGQPGCLACQPSSCLFNKIVQGRYLCRYLHRGLTATTAESSQYRRGIMSTHSSS